MPATAHHLTDFYLVSTYRLASYYTPSSDYILVVSLQAGPAEQPIVARLPRQKCMRNISVS
jgi:hypothetical protein